MIDDISQVHKGRQDAHPTRFVLLRCVLAMLNFKF
jgi:hypothetical protein